MKQLFLERHDPDAFAVQQCGACRIAPHREAGRAGVQEDGLPLPDHGTDVGMARYDEVRPPGEGFFAHLGEIRAVAEVQ